MSDFGAIWEWVKALGPGGASLCLWLWLDERRERRQVQRHVVTLHRDNTKRLDRLLRKLDDLAMGVRATRTVKSARGKRRGGD